MKFVLEQDKPAFIRLTGVSILQSAASSVLAPTLRCVAFCLHALGFLAFLTRRLNGPVGNGLLRYLGRE